MTIEEHYKEYFKLFRDHAPKEMVEWGGYQKGEPTGMASSLESILAFAKLVKDENATIINAGAGASSYILRAIFTNVICTDPDLEYLKVVKNICRIAGFNTDNFQTGLAQGDYCYYDYGNIERIPEMQSFIDSTKYALYIDDCDTRPECKEMRDYVYSLPYKVEDCKEACDEYGRWGVILKKGLFAQVRDIINSVNK